MGYNTWYQYGRSATEADVLTQARAMKSRGLLAAGYDLITIDDGWQGTTPAQREAGVELTWNQVQFPHGIPWLAIQQSYSQYCTTVILNRLLGIVFSLFFVEGRAGQVLRSLTVDLLRLREAVDAESAPLAEPQPKATRSPGPRCPTCRAGLAGGLAHQVVRSQDPDGSGDRDLVVAYCPGCGSVIPVVDRS